MNANPDILPNVTVQLKIFNDWDPTVGVLSDVFPSGYVSAVTALDITERTEGIYLVFSFGGQGLI